MLTQFEIFIAVILFIVGIIFGTTRVGKIFSIILVGMFLLSLLYSYCTTSNHIFLLVQSGETVKAFKITANWVVYWLWNTVLFRLPPGLAI